MLLREDCLGWQRPIEVWPLSCKFTPDGWQFNRVQQLEGIENDLLQAFLEHIPDDVYFKHRDSLFGRISLSLASQFGLSDASSARRTRTCSVPNLQNRHLPTNKRSSAPAERCWGKKRRNLGRMEGTGPTGRTAAVQSVRMTSTLKASGNWIELRNRNRFAAQSMLAFSEGCKSRCQWGLRSCQHLVQQLFDGSLGFQY